MFTPLKGMDHTKAYLKNKEYRIQFKTFRENKINEYIQLLSTIHTCTIHTNHFTYILSPSFYDKTYQFTTFNRDMLPLSHHTYHTISELVNDMDHAFFYLQTPEINKYILNEAI